MVPPRPLVHRRSRRNTGVTLWNNIKQCVLFKFRWLKGPTHLGKSCYIRRGCVPMNTFDATDYESAILFF